MQLKLQWIRSKYDTKEFLKRSGGEVANMVRDHARNFGNHTACAGPPMRLTALCTLKN